MKKISISALTNIILAAVALAFNLALASFTNINFLNSYVTINSISLFIILLLDSRVSDYLASQINSENECELQCYTLLNLSLMTSLSTMISLVVVSRFGFEIKDWLALHILNLMIFFINTFCNGFGRANDDYKSILIFRVLAQASKLIILIPFFFFGYIKSGFLICCLILMFLLILVARYYKFSIVLNLKIYNHFKESFPLYLSSISAAPLKELDTILIGTSETTLNVGAYKIAKQIYSGFQLIADAINFAMLRQLTVSYIKKNIVRMMVSLGIVAIIAAGINFFMGMIIPQFIKNLNMEEFLLISILFSIVLLFSIPFSWISYALIRNKMTKKLNQSSVIIVIWVMLSYCLLTYSENLIYIPLAYGIGLIVPLFVVLAHKLVLNK